MSRLNFPYFMNEQAIVYIIEAVKMVAMDGWKLLPQVIIIVLYYALSVLPSMINLLSVRFQPNHMTRAFRHIIAWWGGGGVFVCWCTHL